MAKRWQTKTTTVGDALRDAYAELGALRDEVATWAANNGPRLGPDNTDRGYRLRLLSDILDLPVPPEVSLLPADVRSKEIRININIGHKGRAARRDNALAHLRPAAAVIKKAGFPELAETIRGHVESVRGLLFPQAFERGWG